MTIIDIHTHAFPDKVAARALTTLATAANATPHTRGTLNSLLRSMGKAGVDVSVVACIATKPEQFRSILEWCQAIASDRVIPLASVHPLDPAAVEHVHEISASGIRGIKIHPYYQDFSLDDPVLASLFGALQKLDLLVLCHTGFDMAFPRTRRCDPEKIARVISLYPTLRFIATHLGAWQDWEEVARHLIGKSIYIDTAYSIDYCGPERARELILAHPKEYVLFGSDSPWDDQHKAILDIKNLRLGVEREALILGGNARRLLNLETNSRRPG